MLPSLRLTNASSAPDELVIRDGEQVLGRSADADLRLNESFVSGFHARFNWQKSGLAVLDLDSTNGTRVNGVPVIGWTSLTDGDVIEFGGVQATVALPPETERASLATTAVPPPPPETAPNPETANSSALASSIPAPAGRQVRRSVGFSPDLEEPTVRFHEMSDRSVSLRNGNGDSPTEPLFSRSEGSDGFGRATTPDTTTPDTRPGVPLVDAEPPVHPPDDFANYDDLDTIGFDFGDQGEDDRLVPFADDARRLSMTTVLGLLAVVSVVAVIAVYLLVG